ncbi:hypothetical protein [Streptomyces chartreusis]|uniref:hypothetical protein n=1 Tax=Streptomyces chartreusis TaxID=1969 RepID=UPI0033A05550
MTESPVTTATALPAPWPLPSPPEHAYRELEFRYGGVAFSCLVSDSLYDDQLAHLAHYLPAAEPEQPPVATHRVRVTCDEQLYRGLVPERGPDGLETAFGSDTYAMWRLPGARLLRPHPPFSAWLHDDHLFAVAEGVTDIVTHPGTAGPCTYLMYVLREVLLRAQEDNGGVLFHAACAVAGGRSALIVGEKGAGKTTTLSALVGGGAMSFCANDRTFVLGPSPRTVAVPVALRLGYGLVEATPPLREYVRGGRLFRPQVRGSEPTGAPEEFGSRVKHIVTPAEFAMAMGTALSTGGRLSLLLFPSLSDDDRPFHSASVSAEEARRLLASSCYTPADPAFVRPRFRTPLSSPEQRAAQAARVCRALPREVPAYRIGWGVRRDPAETHRDLRALCASHGWWA